MSVRCSRNNKERSSVFVSMLSSRLGLMPDLRSRSRRRALNATSIWGRASLSANFFSLTAKIQNSSACQFRFALTLRMPLDNNVRFLASES